MDPPLTRYATTDDDVHIAYQVVGDGPIDLVFVHASVSHIELFWELPSFQRFVRELSSWARVILFDKRGVGLVLWSGGVRIAEAPDYPWGMDEGRFEERLAIRMELWATSRGARRRRG
ncbi:MAG: hypothetical protein ACRDGO_07180 [Actinomycetota bacterium]